MNNKKFGILLTVINALSIITLEKYWKNGIRFVFKKKNKSAIATTAGLSDILPHTLEVASTEKILQA